MRITEEDDGLRQVDDKLSLVEESVAFGEKKFRDVTLGPGGWGCQDFEDYTEYTLIQQST
jgi:hypothetical protein